MRFPPLPVIEPPRPCAYTLDTESLIFHSSVAFLSGSIRMSGNTLPYASLSTMLCTLAEKPLTSDEP